MNTALAIIEQAVSDGLAVKLLPNGNLKLIGEQETVSRWVPRLRQHKAEIVEALRRKETPQPLAAFCGSACPWLETLTLPGDGVTPGCANAISWPGEWKRLDRMTGCPAMQKRNTPSPLPEWCNVDCQDRTMTTLADGRVVRVCWHRGWRGSGIIEKMTGCPKGKHE